MIAGPQAIVGPLNKHQRRNAVAPEVVTPTELVTLAREQEYIDRLAAAQTDGVVFSDIAAQRRNFPATVCIASG